MRDLTKDEKKSLVCFIEFNLIDVIQRDSSIDNFDWLCNMCSAYKKLKEGVEE